MKNIYEDMQLAVEKTNAVVYDIYLHYNTVGIENLDAFSGTVELFEQN